MAKVQIPLKKATSKPRSNGKTEAAKAKASDAAAVALKTRIARLKEDKLAGDVYELLKKRVGNWADICGPGNAGVSHSWISKFVNGHIADSSHRRLTSLRDWLKTHPQK